MQRKEHPVEKIRCRDGSDTLYSSLFGQHYHNPNGAIEESEYVFFQQSDLLNALATNRAFNILEIGFGTGLNLLLLAYFKSQYPHFNQSITFRSVEAFPLSERDFLKLNYFEKINAKNTQKGIQTFFAKPQKGMNTLDIDTQIDTQVYYGFFKEMPLEKFNLTFDFIFFDAFSPEANPELWNPEVFERLINVSSENCVLATYSAASKARAAMAVAGWKLAKCRGALGKREMTVASPSEETLRFGDLKLINAFRLADRWKAGEFKR